MKSVDILLGVDREKLDAADPEPDQDDLMAPLTRAIRDLVRSELGRLVA